MGFGDFNKLVISCLAEFSNIIDVDFTGDLDNFEHRLVESVGDDRVHFWTSNKKDLNFGALEDRSWHQVKEIFEFFLFRFINAIKYKEELGIGISISCDKKIIPERS